MLIVGLIFDCIGWCGVMVVVLLVFSVLFIVMVMVDDWFIFLVLCMLFGIVLSGVLVVGMIYFVEEMDSCVFGLVMGLYIGGNVIGGMSGCFIVGIVVDYWGWCWGIGVVLLIVVVSMLLLWV